MEADAFEAEGEHHPPPHAEGPQGGAGGAPAPAAAPPGRPGGAVGVRTGPAARQPGQGTGGRWGGLPPPSGRGMPLLRGGVPAMAGEAALPGMGRGAGGPGGPGGSTNLGGRGLMPRADEALVLAQAPRARAMGEVRATTDGTMVSVSEPEPQPEAEPSPAAEQAQVAARTAVQQVPEARRAAEQRSAQSFNSDAERTTRDQDARTRTARETEAKVRDGHRPLPPQQQQARAQQAARGHLTDDAQLPADEAIASGRGPTRR